MKLIIAEKYKVAQSFAQLLGATERHTTNNRGTVGFLQTPDGEWGVTWAAGHVIAMDMPDEYDSKYKSWSIDLLPIIPTKWRYHPSPQEPAKSQWKILKELVNRSDVTDIYHAADADREGEMIGREILREAGAPRDKQYWRLWYTNTTSAALQRAISDAKPLIEYRDLGAAADCRQKLDWIYGLNMTRAFTDYAHSVHNVGRVVSPTINLIVERQKEIDEFVPEDFATITVPLIKDAAGDAFKAEAKFADIPKAEALAKTLKGKPATIVNIEQKTENEYRKLYNTTQLQSEAAERFGYEPEATMKIMQELYDNGYISYPRTKSNSINEDQIDETKDLPALAWEHVFGKPSQCAASDFDIQRIVEKKKKGAEEASHTGLTPTDVGIKAYQSRIKGDEKQRNIFLLISCRLICSVLPPRTVDKTKVDIDIENETFKANGSVEVDPGFSLFEKYVKSALSSKKKPKKTTDQVLPDLAVGDVCTCGTAKCAKKQTKPPQQYTTAQLISTMENISRIVADKKMKEMLKDAGLGTAASRDAVIATIKKNGFVEVKAGKLYPTDKAKSLMALLPEDLKSPIMTGQMELQLDAIARGDGDPAEFMAQISERVTQEVENIRKLPPIPDTDRFKNEPVFMKSACPNCGEDVAETAKSMVCKHNCGFIIWRTVAKKKVPKTEIKHMLEHGHTSCKLDGFKSKKGSEFSCWLYIDGTNKVKFDFSDDGMEAKTKNILALRKK